MNSVILHAGARVLVALLLVFSVYMLIRGHNEPGGGFIGGLIAAVGFVVYAISCGTAQAKDALRLPPERLAAAGVGIALIAGLFPILFGHAPFTGEWLKFGGDDGELIKLSSVLVFDIGVYFTVMGAILTLFFALEDAV